MYRRRRRPEKEIAFSFDSFLDLVANVVGIIIRLILVAWVGARTYTGVFRPLFLPPVVTGKDLAGSDLIGIWADRTDIGDSREYARRLRQQAEHRTHQGRSNAP